MIENFIVPKSASDSTTLQPFQCELKARRGATAQVPGAAKFFWRKVWAPAKGRVAAPQVAANKTAVMTVKGVLFLCHGTQSVYKTLPEGRLVSGVERCGLIVTCLAVCPRKYTFRDSWMSRCPSLHPCSDRPPISSILHPSGYGSTRA